MARQRFIWPSMWTDKTFGKLTPEEKVLFIAMFSLADDEGRLIGSAAFLKGHVFPYEAYSAKKVTAIRDGIVLKMPNVWLYEANDEEYVALLKWSDHQKPKYPKPSVIPPPFPEDSGNVPPELEGHSPVGWVGLDRDGLDLGLPTGGTVPVENLEPSDHDLLKPDFAASAALSIARVAAKGAV